MKETYFRLQKRESSGKLKLLVRFLFVFFGFALALNLQAQQNINISGNIVDEAGEPIIGASVIVVGQTLGTVSDLDGNYSISAPSNSSLKISYMGYTQQIIAVDGKTTINVVMKEDLMKLDEVVVIGYGTVKKRDLTGSVVSIKADDIVLNPGNNPMQALQGKVPGLDITKESGQAGGSVNMQIRGNRTFSDENSGPLFIIDGLPGDYGTLNPNDIESIEILKDASSTAVYGAQGANGIVIITTKKGKEGKPVINFNSHIGLNGFSKVPKVRRGESYINTLREASAATGNWASSADDHKLFASTDTYQAYLDNKWIDWADETLEDGYILNNSLSISGGTDKTKAYVSFNFSDEVGQFANDNYKVYSTQINVDHKVAKWINTGINLQASYTHQNKRGSTKLDRALRSIPLGEAYDADGNINPRPTAGDPSFISILSDKQGGVYKNRVNNTKVYANPYVELKPIKGLSILSRLNGSLNISKARVFNGIDSYNYYQNGITNASITDYMNYNYKWENIFTYNFNLDEKHDFTVTGVTSWSHNQQDYDYMYGEGITDNKYLWYNMDATTNQTIDSKHLTSKGMRYVGRINYSYLGKYLLSASISRDGSSKLAKGHQWSTYPAVSAGWRVSDENFMESTKDWLSNAKLRLSWGISGTDNTSINASRGYLEQGYLSIGNEALVTYYPSQVVSNPYLTWENSYNTNIGLDLDFLNGRINLSTDFYITNTKGVILDRELPVHLGAYSASKYYKSNVNLAATRNTGFEVALNTRNIVTKDFTWSSAITFATNNEKIRKLQNDNQKEIVKSDGTIWRTGEAINSFYNFKILGVWQKGEEADAAVFGCEPGYYKLATPNLTKVSDGLYRDKDGNEYSASNKYTYGEADKVVLGHNSPDWTAGFQNTFTYKDFDLTVYLFARWGQMINYELLGAYDPSGKTNFPSHFNYWTENNPANDFPAANSGMKFENYIGYGARPYVDGSFFKIKNITLGYTLPKKLLQKASISKLRVYGTVTNPLVYSKSHLIEDYDPEMNGKMDYPLTKQVVFGLNLTF